MRNDRVSPELTFNRPAYNQRTPTSQNLMISKAKSASGNQPNALKIHNSYEKTYTKGHRVKVHPDTR